MQFKPSQCTGELPTEKNYLAQNSANVESKLYFFFQEDLRVISLVIMFFENILNRGSSIDLVPGVKNNMEPSAGMKGLRFYPAYKQIELKT